MFLSDRWYKLRPHKKQSRSMRSKYRFNINHSGRRSGKTEIFGKRRVIKKALIGNDSCDWRGFVSAPTRNQAKKIYWADLKALSPPSMLARRPDESNLIIFYINGSQIHCLGMDRPERVEGPPWDHGVLDEYGNMKPKTWPEHVRPALSDRKGSCDFVGVPEGRNHYWELVQTAKADTTESWKVWHWPSWEIIDPEEVEAAKRDLDELVFKQEYGGDFVSYTGAAYYAFNEHIHVGKYSHLYNPTKPLVLCFDFNVSPGTASIIQELGPDVFDIPVGQTVTVVMDEVHIKRNSNTPMVCRKILENWSKHPGIVICYGDSTGGSQGTAKVKGNDWDLIKQSLIPYFGDRLYFKVPKHNPKERQRVNAVNSRLKSYSGLVRMVIDGKKCPNIVKDFQGVRVIEGSAGEIDKKRDPMLSHLTDGIGYYIHKEFPVGAFYSRQDVLDMMAAHNKAEIDKQLRKQRKAA